MAELDLVQEELRELAGGLIDATTDDPSTPFGVYVIHANTRESELARAVERTVFDETFGNPADLLDAEYGPYEESTVFFCVLDHRRRLPAGSMRLILPSDRGLKTFHEMVTVWGVQLDDVLASTGVEWDPRHVWDVTTLAVAREYRGKSTDGLISMALYQTLVRSVVEGGARWLVTILDTKPLELIQTLTHGSFFPFDGVEPISYLESPLSVPVYVDFDEWEPRFREVGGDSYDLLFNGIGIEAGVRGPLWTTLQHALGESPDVPLLVRR